MHLNRKIDIHFHTTRTEEFSLTSNGWDCGTDSKAVAWLMRDFYILLQIAWYRN